MNEKQKKYQRNYANNRRKKYIEFLRDFKSKKSCVLCGWSEHTEILCFHHKDESQKKFELSSGNAGGYGIDKIKEEIAKCVLLCPNCHMWLHFERRSWA